MYRCSRVAVISNLLDLAYHQMISVRRHGTQHFAQLKYVNRSVSFSKIPRTSVSTPESIINLDRIVPSVILLQRSRLSCVPDPACAAILLEACGMKL